MSSSGNALKTSDGAGAAAVVELAAAVIGYIDPLDAVIESDHGVLRGGDSLDDQRDPVLVLDQFDGSPLKSHLEFAAADAQAARADVTLGDIALTAAVMRRIDGQAERGKTVNDGPG